MTNKIPFSKLLLPGNKWIERHRVANCYRFGRKLVALWSGVDAPSRPTGCQRRTVDKSYHLAIRACLQRKPQLADDKQHMRRTNSAMWFVWSLLLIERMCTQAPYRRWSAGVVDWTRPSGPVSRPEVIPSSIVQCLWLSYIFAVILILDGVLFMFLWNRCIQCVFVIIGCNGQIIKA